MTETTAGYYTHADLIRQALSSKPRTRAEIIRLTDLTKTELSKAIYYLKKEGEIVEEGELLVHIDANRWGATITAGRGRRCSTSQIWRLDDGRGVWAKLPGSAGHACRCRGV